MKRKGSPPRLRCPAEPITSEPLNKSAFARLLKCDPARVTQLLKSGPLKPPAVTEDGLIVPDLAIAALEAAGCFAPRTAPPTPAQVAAACAPGETYDQARTRLASGQADAQEMANEERRGLLLDATETFRFVEANCRQLTTRLLAIPSAHAAQIARFKTALEVQDYLYGVLNDALQELSDGFASYGKRKGPPPKEAG